MMLITGLISFAQTDLGFLNAGVEYNYYPAGHLIGLQTEIAVKRDSHKDAFQNPHHSVNFRLGVNLTDRKDFSKFNDHESGWGYGASVGYRYYLSRNWRAGYAGLYFGARSDVWLMNINWEDASQMPSSGKSSITVVQPTFEIGYKLPIMQYDIILGIANGVELNVRTVGDEVGHGWITEAQLVIARRLYH
ncbi:MAG: hypothetical protein JXR19_05765 [Bacteroidia bacterium]